MISHDEIIQALKRHSIYATANRVKVLFTANQLKTNISTVTVLQAIDYSIERTSVHRALRLFCKKGFLVAVPNTNGIIEYHLADQHTNHYDQQKATFICLQCGHLRDVIVKVDFLCSQKNICIREIMVKGLCEQCSHVTN
jgi:Fe2+ or Zn2+ uptake regulation protein